MGLQVRKRTKGKDGWWNGSYSNKGAGVSGSVKVASNVTYNTGDLLNGKTGSRLTINLGNGIRYVSYGKKRSTSNKKPTQTSNNQYTKQVGVLPMIAAAIKLIAALALALFVGSLLIGMIVYALGG